MEIDTGHAALKQLLRNFSTTQLSEANEAETRKKVIDRIIENVLGWDPINDINYETRVTEDGKTTFADYKITTATTAIVIEAKSIGKAFDLPTTRTSLKLGGVLSEGDVGAAIMQVRDYARKLAIQFAVATNGSAWIIFPAIRTDGITFENTYARIFRSIEDIKTRFVEFWELLSRQRAIEGGLENELFGLNKIEIPRRLISQFREPGFRLGRNNIYEYIEPAINSALTDESLLNDLEGLSACYVKSTERLKHDSRLHMYLKDLKPPLGRKVVRPRTGKEEKVLDKTISKTEIGRNQFILILGPVGAGKTTFLYYTRKISGRKLIDNKIMWFYIDYKRATEADRSQND